MTRRATILTDPATGLRVRCTANKRWALAAVIQHDGEARLKVLLRTDNSDTLRSKGRREVRRLNRPVHVFNLHTGKYLGRIIPERTPA